MARGAAAECKNPLISPIAIFPQHSTLDDFKGKEWNFLFKKKKKTKKTQKYV